MGMGARTNVDPKEEFSGYGIIGPCLVSKQLACFSLHLSQLGQSCCLSTLTQNGQLFGHFGAQ